MRVLYDNEIFLIQKYGGATRYFYELIKRMPALKTEVLLYMGKFINEYGLEEYANRFTVFSGKRIKHIPRTKLISIKLQKPLFERFAGKQNFDLLHQTYYADINVKKKFKRIITIHDFTHEKLSGNFSSLDKTAELKKLSVEKSDGIICVSESTKNDLMERYDTKGKKVKVIYHGNSLKYDVTEEPVIKDKYLLYVGDRRSYKNFGVVVKLFGMNENLRNDYKLVCCGGGKFTKDEQYTLMTLFSIFRSPLMFGGNLPDNDPFTNSLLTNKEVLNVHSRSINNRQLFNNNDKIAWTADDPVTGEKYLALFYIADQKMLDRKRVDPNSPEPPDSVQVPVNLKDLGLGPNVSISNLWNGKDVGSFAGEFSPWVRRHGTGFYKLSAKRGKDFSKQKNELN